jgi:hypothetical protein
LLGSPLVSVPISCKIEPGKCTKLQQGTALCTKYLDI